MLMFPQHIHAVEIGQTVTQPLTTQEDLGSSQNISNEQIIQLFAFHVVGLVHRTEKREEAFRRNKRIVELGVFLAATLESPEIQGPSESL